MTNIIGIDLGTTLSAIAKLNELAKPEIIPNDDGHRLTPSVILFDDDITFIGEDAKSHTGLADKTAKEFKRQMHNSDYRFTVGDKALSATELSSLVLKKLTQDIDTKDVVISVPAYFGERQRKATMDAGKLAGLNVMAIINEPTAAALYYASKTNLNNKTVLIYDLGGGTFDVSVAKINGNEVTVLSSEGDPHLGGVDFDNIILEIATEKYKNKYHNAPYEDRNEKQERLYEAEDFKKQLSSRDKHKWHLKPDSGVNLVVEISREEFEEKLSFYVSKTEILVEQALEGAKLEVKDIDEVLLVGGSTRIPVFSKSVQEMIGKVPQKNVNPDEAVALGAAIKAGLVMLETKPESLSDNIKSKLVKIKLTDVANNGYGVIVLSYDEKLQKDVFENSIIIPKNTPLPCSESKLFSTRHDGQESVNIRITQGEEDVEFIEVIKEFSMKLPPNRPKGQELEFTYSYDTNQRMHCTFEDVESGNIMKCSLYVGDEISSDTVDSFIVE